MTDKQRFDALVQVIKGRIPGFEIRYKTDSRLMAVINFIVRIFCPTFMTKFTTTLYPRVYFPSKEVVEKNYDRYFEVLAHEYAHLWRFQESGNFLQSVRYLTPQIYATPALLSLLAVGAFWKLWMLWFLTAATFLLFLLPWRSRSRMEIEFHAFSMSYAIVYWRDGKVDPVYLNFFVEQFSGWPYYRMWPNETEIRQKFYEVQRTLERGQIGVATMDQPFIDVFQIVKSLP